MWKVAFRFRATLIKFSFNDLRATLFFESSKLLPVVLYVGCVFTTNMLDVVTHWLSRCLSTGGL